MPVQAHRACLSPPSQDATQRAAGCHSMPRLADKWFVNVSETTRRPDTGCVRTELPLDLFSLPSRMPRARVLSQQYLASRLVTTTCCSNANQGQARPSSSFLDLLGISSPLPAPSLLGRCRTRKEGSPPRVFSSSKLFSLRRCLQAVHISRCY